nr:hypothetical protein [Candidatus Sigynarchaeota archaeon]
MVLDIKIVRPRKDRECGLCKGLVERNRDCIFFDYATVGTGRKDGQRFSQYYHPDCYSSVMARFASFVENMHKEKGKLSVLSTNEMEQIRNEVHGRT